MRLISILVILMGSIFHFKGQDSQFNQLDKNNNKTGPWIGYHEKTNSKRYVGKFVNGKPIGIFNYYGLEGHLSAKVNFINDSVSSSEMYYDNSGLMAKGKFLNKMKEGKWFTYSRYGDILNIFNFTKGAMHGKQYLYYPANKETNQVKLMEEYYCENGLKNGEWKQYFKLGTLKAKGNYTMGKKNGVFIYYFSNGAIDTRGLFVNNQKHGPWLFFDGDNKNMKKVNYNKGEVIEKNINEE